MIEYINCASVFGGGASLAVGLPAGSDVGDLVLLSQFRYGGGFATAPAGSTPLTPTHATFPVGWSQHLREVDGTQGSTFTFTNVNTWPTILIAELFRGVDLDDPVDVGPTFQINNASATHLAPSLTPTADDGMLVTHHVNWYVQAYTSQAAGMTKTINVLHGGNLDAMGAVLALGAAGVATGTKGAVAPNSSVSNGGSLILRAAGASGPELGRRLLLGTS